MPWEASIYPLCNTNPFSQPDPLPSKGASVRVPVNITGAQWWILNALKLNSPQSLDRVSHQRMRSIQILVDRGWLSRAKNSVSITDAGLKVLNDGYGYVEVPDA